MSRQLAQWVFFTVLLSLTPIVLDVLPALTIGVPLDMMGILGHGVLLPVAVAVVASGAAEIQDVASATARVILSGSLVLVVILGSAWYADVSGVIRGGGDVALATVAAGSLLLFLMACAVKLGAMLCFRSSSDARGVL